MKLEDKEYILIKEFINKLTRKLEKAREEYGSDYSKLNREMTMKEVEEELIDIAGWSMMFWMKLKRKGVLK